MSAIGTDTILFLTALKVTVIWLLMWECLKVFIGIWVLRLIQDTSRQVSSMGGPCMNLAYIAQCVFTILQ